MNLSSLFLTINDYETIEMTFKSAVFNRWYARCR